MIGHAAMGGSGSVDLAFPTPIERFRVCGFESPAVTIRFGSSETACRLGLVGSELPTRKGRLRGWPRRW